MCTAELESGPERTPRGPSTRPPDGPLAALSVTAGCLGVPTGQPATFSASEPSVDDAVARSSGYELALSEARTGNRTFSVVGRSREARVTSHLAEYQETVDLGPLGSTAPPRSWSSRRRR